MLLSTTTAFYCSRPEGYNVPILDSIKRCAKAGFDSIDLNFCQAFKLEPILSGDKWMDWVEQAKETLAQAGIGAGQSHTPFYNVLDKNIDDVDAVEETVRRSVIISGMLGVKWVTIHAGTFMNDPRMSRSKAGNLEYFAPYLELAGKYGTGIAIENLFDAITPSKVRDLHRYTADLEHLIDLVDTLSQRYPNVGICWDFGHANEMSWDQPLALRTVGKRLKSTHVNDNYGLLDDHLLPFLGTVNWPEIMPVLREIGYEGDFAYETHKFTKSLPEPLIDAALDYSVKVGRYLLSL